MTNLLKIRIHRALDEIVGQDFIESVFTIRQTFGLSHSDFYPVFTIWYCTN